ncbi:hypothetical protein [Nannocystis sp. SCPEA4]|uniref:hypothetical protein n=1 Tax=Nannocystis sp. SCPEA4 TaxID=2996787 RepID=UPI002271A7AE|nr:hypothetical protein [Nannocystis sp. SCPEA4]MCY1060260.1 hypothetical protein [Nannocystis sp. SCPEA4]
MSTANHPGGAAPRKRVLIVGLEPRFVDFSQFPGLDEARLTAGLRAAEQAVAAAGFDVAWCLTDVAWEQAEPLLRERLAADEFAAIVIGAGLRTPPPLLLLFERVVNLVHEAAPRARLCFNTSPETTAAAVLRWVRP